MWKLFQCRISDSGSARGTCNACIASSFICSFASPAANARTSLTSRRFIVGQALCSRSTRRRLSKFDADQDWDGWLVLFRPEFLLPSHTKAPVSNLSATRGLEHLPKHSSLQDHQLRFVLDAVHQMREDSRIEAPSAEVHALLRHDLHALLLRLSIMQGRVAAQRNATSLGLQLFRSFQKLVEKNFAQLHQVADYADLLGCSGKSLTRAAMEVAGVKAKEVIASRINLEAKRLLAYTTLPIALIGDSLGFDEATNFVKFFKREAGCTPGEFRRRQGEPRTL